MRWIATYETAVRNLQEKGPEDLKFVGDKLYGSEQNYKVKNFMVSELSQQFANVHSPKKIKRSLKFLSIQLLELCIGMLRAEKDNVMTRGQEGWKLQRKSSMSLKRKKQGKISTTRTKSI